MNTHQSLNDVIAKIAHVYLPCPVILARLNETAVPTQHLASYVICHF